MDNPIKTLISKHLEVTGTYEKEHVEHVFLDLAYLRQNDYLQLHPFAWKHLNFIFLYS